MFVATIIPLASAGQETAGRTFNAAIPGIVQSKVNAGKHVHLVDMHSALTTADLTDGIHPTAAATTRWPPTWYAALRSVPGSIGDPGSGTGTGRALVSAASGRCLDVPGSNTANGTQPIIWDCNGARQPALDGHGSDPAGARQVPRRADRRRRRSQGPDLGLQRRDQPAWTLNTDGTISSAQSGLCLDVNGNATANGTTVILWTCTAAANQRWTRA